MRLGALFACALAVLRGSHPRDSREMPDLDSRPNPRSCGHGLVSGESALHRRD